MKIKIFFFQLKFNFQTIKISLSNTSNNNNSNNNNSNNNNSNNNNSNNNNSNNNNSNNNNSNTSFNSTSYQYDNSYSDNSYSDDFYSNSSSEEYSLENQFSYISSSEDSYLIGGDKDNDNQNNQNDNDLFRESSITVNLDQNSGMIPDQDILNQYTQQYTCGNINGYQPKNIQLRKEIEQYRLQLLQLFQFDRVYYIHGAADFIKRLQSILLNKLYVFEGNHPSANLSKDQQSKQSKQSFCALINLVNSSSCYLQQNQIKQANHQQFKYIILDCTQAVGRVSIPTQKIVDCIFFSTHKFTGLFNSGFVFMSNNFFDEVFKNTLILPTDPYKEIKDQYFLTFNYSTFDIPGFIESYFITKDYYQYRPDMENLKHTYTTLLKTINSTKHILNKTPSLETGQINLYSSLLFKTDTKICVKSLQNYLAQRNINIGFSTACTTGRNGTLRLSWRDGLTQEQLDYFVQVFPEVVDLVAKLSNPDDMAPSQDQLKGGSNNSKSIETSNLKNGIQNLHTINKNYFWLRSHFVKSSDKATPPIPDKYAILFQDFILNQKIMIGIVIPELKLRKRISKYLYINPQLRQLDKRQQVEVKPDAFITVNMFKRYTDGIYPDLDDLIAQNFEGKYFMSKYRYEFIKSHGLDINHEFLQKNNPMSEYVTNILLHKQNIQIKELLISASNSYINNIKFLDKNFVTKCEMYRSGKKNYKYINTKKNDTKNTDTKNTTTKKNDTKDIDTKNTSQNIKETTKELLKGGNNDNVKGENNIKGGQLPKDADSQPKTITGYCDTIQTSDYNKLFIVQPVLSVKELQKMYDLVDDIIKHKSSMILILNGHVDKKYIHSKLNKEDGRQWCCFDNFQHYWFQDPNIEIYTYHWN